MKRRNCRNYKHCVMNTERINECRNENNLYDFECDGCKAYLAPFRNPAPSSSCEFLAKANINLHYSDAAGHKKKADDYKGYYINYAEFDPVTGDMGKGCMQHILPHLKERTPENDKLAVAVFNDFAVSISRTFDKHLKASHGYKIALG